MKIKLYPKSVFLCLVFLICLTGQAQIPYDKLNIDWDQPIKDFTVKDYVKESNPTQQPTRRRRLKDFPIQNNYLKADRYLQKTVSAFFKTKNRFPKSFKELDAFVEKKLDLTPLGTISMKKLKNGNFEITIKKTDKNGTIQHKLVFKKDGTGLDPGNTFVDSPLVMHPPMPEPEQEPGKITIIGDPLSETGPIKEFSVGDLKGKEETQKKGELILQYVKTEMYLVKHSLAFFKKHKKWPPSYIELDDSISKKLDLSPMGKVNIKTLLKGSCQIEVKKTDSHGTTTQKIIINQNGDHSSDIIVEKKKVTNDCW